MPLDQEFAAVFYQEKYIVEEETRNDQLTES